MIALPLVLAGCALPNFDQEFDQYGLIAQDYTVDRLQVLAVRASPPLALPGTPRTVEALVVAPGGTRTDATVTFSVCGLLEVGAVGVSDLRCFENPDLVDAIGEGNPRTWDVPQVSFPECVPFDAVGGFGPDPGDSCASVVPLLARAETADGQVATGANSVVVPAEEVPEQVSYLWSDTGLPELEPTVNSTVITSFADPTLPVTVTASGLMRPGSEVTLVATVEDRYYNHVAWWVDAGTLTQSGRTLIVEDVFGHRRAHNTLVLPKEAPDTVMVWIVANDWFASYSDPPSPSHMPVAQPAWAEVTIEVAR